MAERDRIARYFAPLTTSEPGSLNLEDDAALLSPPPGQQLVITTDSVIESIHVLAGATPQQFAQKLIRRNLSDLAAMGATPWRYSLNLHTPTGLADGWFADFAAALHEEQTRFGLVLIGGDSTSGGERIYTSMTCIGLLDAPPLRRNGATPGDDLYVSGTLGDAAFALSMLQQHSGQPCSSSHGVVNVAAAALAARYHCPTPRLELGKMLHAVASAAIDISDGLIADMQQICNASTCAAEIELADLPLSDHLENAALDAAAKYRFALSGGDDYELLFTAPPTQRDAIAAIAASLNLPLTRIGRMVRGHGVQVIAADGSILTSAETGWEYR